jgi:hypothetical protein
VGVLKKMSLENNKIIKYSLFAGIIITLASCGTFTGIPSHGGGKRFAIEQELVAGTVKKSVNDLDLSSLKGKNVALSIVGMGDQGSGTMNGGRGSIVSSILGNYISTPTNQFPTTTGTTTTGTTTTTTQSVLNSSSRTVGNGQNVSVGVTLGGIPSYNNAAVLNPNDAVYLSSIIQQHFVKNNITLSSIENASHLVYVNVDIFGTIRSRTDWAVTNSETLKAKTTMEVTIVNLKNKKQISDTQLSGYEAEYKENYFLWMGPLKTTKEIYKSDDSLIDVTESREIAKAAKLNKSE